MPLSAEAWAAREVMPWFDDTKRELAAFRAACRNASATQMKGLARVASEAEVAEQVITLVRYQMGRPKDPLPVEVGSQLLEAVKRIRQTFAATADSDDRDRAEMERIRAMVGQVARWHHIYTDQGKKR